MKTPGQILKEAQKVMKKGQDCYYGEKKKLQSALEKDRFAYWAGWSCLSLVWTEKMLARWTNVVKGIEILISEGKTSAEILEHIRGYREGVIEQVMNQRTASSTSLMSNAIENMSQDVDKKFAGRNMIDTDSLAELLYNCGEKA